VRKITVSDIPVKEALNPLRPGPHVGSALRIMNSGPCNNCRRRNRYCDRTEPRCTECRITWDTSCTYPGARAGTAGSLHRARQVRHKEEERKRKVALAKRAKETRQIRTAKSSEDNGHLPQTVGGRRTAKSSGDSSLLPHTMGGRETSNISNGEYDSDATLTAPSSPVS
jgi:hypothetical protein